MGDFEFEASDWKPGTSGPYLPFQIRHKRKPLEWPVVMYSSRLYSDATGNESQKFLSRKEAAWKVRQTITAGKQAPLSPGHCRRFPETKVPQPGETGMQLVEGLPNAGSRKFFGYAGTGSYEFADGAPIALDPERAAKIARDVAANGGAPTVTVGKDQKHWTVAGVAEKPSIVIIDEVASGRWSCEYGYRRGEDWTTLSTSTFAGNGPNNGFIDVRQIPVAEPAGTAVDFQIFWTETFKVEFLVRPPPPGMSALKK